MLKSGSSSHMAFRESWFTSGFMVKFFDFLAKLLIDYHYLLLSKIGLQRWNRIKKMAISLVLFQLLGYLNPITKCPTTLILYFIAVICKSFIAHLCNIKLVYNPLYSKMMSNQGQI